MPGNEEQQTKSSKNRQEFALPKCRLGKSMERGLDHKWFRGPIFCAFQLDRPHSLEQTYCITHRSNEVRWEAGWRRHRWLAWCCVDWRAGLAEGGDLAGARGGRGGQVAGSMADPFRQTALSVGKNTHFSRGIRPLTPIHLAGGGGRRDEKKLDSCVLLALRQFPRLAGRG